MRTAEAAHTHVDPYGRRRALEDKYLRGGADSPIHANSSWRPLVDGEEYFQALRAQIARLEDGDQLYIAGLQVDHLVDLAGRDPHDRGYRPLGEQLANLVDAGVDVRVIMSGGTLWSGRLPRPRFGPFRGNLLAADYMREFVTASGHIPLARRVMLDWSGDLIGTSHQKIVVVSHADELTCFVGGIDLTEWRYDAAPHNRYERKGKPWGWHDAAGRVRGEAAEKVWQAFRLAWLSAGELPVRRYLSPKGQLKALNPRPVTKDPGPPPPQDTPLAPTQSVQVLRSYGPWQRDSLLPWRRERWEHVPEGGIQEIYDAFTTAIDAAETYIYIEDQYLREYIGGRPDLELYAHLREAAERGVKVIMVGSGVRRPDDVGGGPMNITLNPHVRRKIVARLDDESRTNFVLYRVENVTVHAKIVLIDDCFASLGSANMFSRSMAGTDHELTVAVVDSATTVRDLRVRLWAEHLRLGTLRHPLLNTLRDLDSALGIWNAEWLPDRMHTESWQTPGKPEGFHPGERALARVHDESVLRRFSRRQSAAFPRPTGDRDRVPEPFRK